MNEKNASAKVLLQFYLLVIYVLLQFCWWAFMINNLNKEVYQLKQNALFANSLDDTWRKNQALALEQKLKKRWLMLGGEGTVFLVILILGIVKTRNTFKKEIALSKQQRNFLLSVTHELKTPVAVTRIQLETLLKHPLPEEKKRLLIEQALTENKRLELLIEKILLSNSIEGSAYVLQKEQFNLSQCCEEIAASAASGLLKRHRLNAHIEPDIKLFGDKISIVSVIVNLLDNAAKYSPQQSEIGFSIKQDNKQIVLKITDCGRGIDPVEKTKIFNLFYRSENEDTRSTKGTGLGLYIVKNIVAMHQGKIMVDNHHPSGTIFSIYLKPSNNISNG